MGIGRSSIGTNVLSQQPVENVQRISIAPLGMAVPPKALQRLIEDGVVAHWHNYTGLVDLLPRAVPNY